MDIPNSSGETKRQILKHVVEQTQGEVKPPELELNIKCPYELRFAMDTFYKLATLRSEPVPLHPTTIHNWLEMRGQRLSAFEHDALEAIDRVFLEEIGNRT